MDSKNIFVSLQFVKQYYLFAALGKFSIIYNNESEKTKHESAVGTLACKTSSSALQAQGQT